MNKGITMIVYSILNQHNGKRYIGYTTQGLKQRRSGHLRQLRHNRHHNSYLQRTWNRGDRYLLWTILEVCSSLEEVKTAEIKWIAHYNTTDPSIGYNLTYGGDGASHTPEGRTKVSVTMMGHEVTKETRQKIRDGKVGKKRKPFTSEHRTNMSLAQKIGQKGINTWSKGRPFTPEHRANLSAAVKRHWSMKKDSKPLPSD